MAIGFLVLTKSTLTPLDNMGVMTMKMISSTSITSTMGVTLMSATGGGALCFNCVCRLYSCYRHRIFSRTQPAMQGISVKRPPSTRRIHNFS